MYTRTSVVSEFLNAKWDNNTHECDFNTHKIEFYTQSTIATRRVYTRVILSRMRVNNNDTFEQDLNTQSAIPNAECDFKRRMWFLLV
jgi:hypothetical protein